MSNHIFKEGDTICLNGKEYIVIKNYGDKGLVKENKENGSIINGFHWEENNMYAKKVNGKNIDKESIELLKKEYNEFFEKYKI